MTNILTSLHEPDLIYTTGEKPILLRCDDYRLWVCKHSINSSTLVNELIGSQFARIWQIPTPENCFINVHKEHIPNSLQPISFNKTSFGSLYIENSKEIDKSVYSMFNDPSFRAKIYNRIDFLKIALFDIWLANDDRNHGNSNLLLDLSNPSKIRFTAIDHGTLFNTSSLQMGIFQINEYDSILNTQITTLLFQQGSILTKIVNNLIENYYLCVLNCEKELDNILQSIPDNWGIDILILEDLIRNQIFDKEWIEECVENFRALVQLIIK